jgi:hypothetical protein
MSNTLFKGTAILTLGLFLSKILESFMLSHFMQW